MTVILVNAEAGRVPLPDGVVHCSVSSPPYFSLRQYEGDQSRTWPEVSYAPMLGLPPLTISAMHCALGHEETPESFIGHLVACYREVKRVLRDDGACWVVIGDSYANDTKWGGKSGNKNYTSAAGKYQGQRIKRDTGMKQGNLMLIPHRLALALQADGWTVRNDCVWYKVAPMPESVQGTRWTRCRVKVKAQDNNTRGGPHRGYVEHGDTINDSVRAQYTDCPGCPRCEAQPADCPDCKGTGVVFPADSSVKMSDEEHRAYCDANPCPKCDGSGKFGGYVLRRGSWRHTRAHEVVLHLSKGMNYWSNGEVVREPSIGQTGLAASFRRETKDHLIPGQAAIQHRMDREDTSDNGSRNPRSVLVPAGEGGFSGGHYAVFPKNLIRPLIKSSCPVRCCPACGAGWAAVVERGPSSWEARKAAGHDPRGYHIGDNTSHFASNKCVRRDAPDGKGEGGLGWVAKTQVLGYYPTCACHAGNPDPPHAPGVVLDPFFGSGTTGLVARELGVDCIGLDLSYDYLRDQARARLELDAWDAWHQGRDGDVVGDLEGLPLFEGVG